MKILIAVLILASASASAYMLSAPWTQVESGEICWALCSDGKTVIDPDTQSCPVGQHIIGGGCYWDGKD